MTRLRYAAFLAQRWWARWRIARAQAALEHHVWVFTRTTGSRISVSVHTVDPRVVSSEFATYANRTP